MYQDPLQPHPEHKPPRPPAYWRRAHRDWKFWVGVVFMLLAMFVYVESFDLLFQPRIHVQQQGK